MSKDNGGPAFPNKDAGVIFTSGGFEHTEGVGMTLRDYFAAAAMNGLTGNAFKYLAEQRGDEVLTDGAKRMLGELCATSYVIADAMLKERAK